MFPLIYYIKIVGTLKLRILNSLFVYIYNINMEKLINLGKKIRYSLIWILFATNICYVAFLCIDYLRPYSQLMLGLGSFLFIALAYSYVYPEIEKNHIKFFL